ncbi:MAG: hypothetical protein GON13_00125 [Nanoarchaeota archaeon]|nr:hypothetical protein [Nanoarchaeota archaeon]
MAPGLLLSNINSAVEVMLFLLTFTMGAYVFRIHKFTKNRNHKLLAIAFILIGLSFMTKAGLNFAVNNGFLFGNFSLITIIYVAFMLFGYTVLDKLFLNIRTYRVFSIQIILFVLALFLVQLSSLWFFDLVSFLLLSFPVLYFFENYKKKRTRSSLLVLLGFAGVMMSHASFFLIFVNKSLFFVDNLIRLVAYAILLVHYVFINK